VEKKDYLFIKTDFRLLFFAALLHCNSEIYKQSLQVLVGEFRFQLH
jgi:hypothetical protein